MTTRLAGTIKSLTTDRSFGFIKTADGLEYFFHRSNAPEFDTLRIGHGVSFVAETGPKGLRAGDVTRLD